VFLDAQVLNKPEIMIGQAAARINAESGEITDESTRQHLTQQIAALAALVRQKN